MPAWPLFSRRNAHHRTATELYGRLVARSRSPWFYTRLGVPDTPEGRFELVLLHVVLAIRRLAQDGDSTNELARALTETFVTDMDDCLREMGVGDMVVAKKVKRAAAALYDRNRDYGHALDSYGSSGASLPNMLATHAWTTPPPDDAAAELAAYMRRTEARLAAIAKPDILTGRIELPVLGPDGHEGWEPANT